MYPTIIIIIFILTILILILGLTNPLKAQSTTEEQKQKEYLKYDLLEYTIDFNPEQTKLKAKEEYKICPPLRPERFRRRVKMLWGIDIDDYPDDAIISVGGYYTSYVITLSKEYQLLNGFVPDDTEAPYTLPSYHSQNIYSHLRSYLFTNNKESEEKLLAYIKDIKKLHFEGYKVQGISPNGCEDEGIEGADFFIQLYHNAFFYGNRWLLSYNEKLNSPIGLLNLELGVDCSSGNIPMRSSDIRLNSLTLYLRGLLKEGLKFKKHPFYGDENNLWLGFNPNDSISKAPSQFRRLTSYPEEKGSEYNYRPWHSYSAERGMSAFMSFSLQLQTKYMNKFVIGFMSGDVEGFDKYIGLGSYFGSLQKNIKSNNYYGYTLLREFCENPMREMPTLEKIGTSFHAQVSEDNTLLLLEPFADSYDIDTIQTSEVFKAIEMGHDDYYFVEIEKPVESPVADEDGYAMILDRTETVYGYLPKLKVKEYNPEDVLEDSRYKDKSQSKLGLINDADGYVNIRKGAGTNYEVVGKLYNMEIFNYWEIESWYIIETNKGVRGYVHKSRIKEKPSTGGWIIYK